MGRDKLSNLCLVAPIAGAVAADEVEVEEDEEDGCFVSIFTVPVLLQVG